MRRSSSVNSLSPHSNPVRWGCCYPDIQMRKPRHREAKDPEKVTEVTGTRARLRIQAAASIRSGRYEGVTARCSPRPADLALA